MPQLQQIAPPEGVEVSSAPRVPMTSPVLEAATAASSELGNKLTYLGMVLHRQEKLNGLAQGSADYRTGLGQIEDNYLKANPNATPEQRRDDLTKQSRTLMQSVIKNYPVAQDALTEHLAGYQESFENQLRSKYVVEKEQQVKSQFENAIQSGVQAITSTDDPNAQRAHEVEMEALIRNSPMFAGNPDQQDIEIRKMRTQLTEAQINQQIATNPSAAVTALYSPTFLKDHPYLPPEKLPALKAAADTAMHGSINQADAAIAAIQGPKLQQLIAKSAAGTMTQADAQAGVDAGLPPDKMKALLPGFQPEAPENPQLEASLRTMFAADPMSYSHGDILKMVGPGGLAPKQVQRLSGELESAQAKLKGPLGRARATAIEQIVNTLKPPPKFGASFHPAEDAAERESIRRQAAEVLGEATSQTQVQQYTKDFLDNARTHPELFKPGHVGPTALPATAARLPGESDTAWGKRLIKLGIDPAALPPTKVTGP